MNGELIVDCCDAVYAALMGHTDEIAGSTSRSVMVITSTTCCGVEALRAMRAQLAAAEMGSGRCKLAAEQAAATVGGSSGPLWASLLMGCRGRRARECTAAAVATMYGQRRRSHAATWQRRAGEQEP